jgi:hypothetical protein
LQVLSFLVDDWVNAHEPDLVFLEAVVNDGDSVLETGDEAGVRRAVEGIVRQIRARHPHCDIVLVHMLLRGDLPPSRRTGTRAWVDDAVPGAAAVYQQRVPALLDTVAEHYGLPSINLIPALAPLPSQVGGHSFAFGLWHADALLPPAVCVHAFECVPSCLCSSTGRSWAMLRDSSKRKVLHGGVGKHGG